MSFRAPTSFTEKQLASFWTRVRKAEGNACWEWLGPRIRDEHGALGYGAFVVAHQTAVRAHRASWIIHFGAIAADLVVCHHCDNPPCVRPDHLFLGTVADNNSDRDNKGRGRGGGLPGELTPWAKLSDADVLAMRRMRDRGALYREVWAAYPQTSFGNVCRILCGQNWKHLPLHPDPEGGAA